MSHDDIAIIGGGGHAKVVIDSIRAEGHLTLCGVLDDSPVLNGASVMGVPILGPIDETTIAQFNLRHAVIAIGDNQLRRRIAQRFQEILEWERVIHPRSVIGSDVQLGEGCVIFAGAVIQPSTSLGRHTIVNTSASVDHDCNVGDFAHVAPGAHLAGGVNIGDGALIGIGASVLPGRQIGDWATIGAGAVVTRDIPTHVTAIGVPATYEHS